MDIAAQGVEGARAAGTRRLCWGLLLVAVIWPLNWGLEGSRTHLLFFPL